MSTEGLLVVSMVTNVKIKSGVCHKRLLLAFLLLIGVFVSLCVYPFLIVGVGNVSLEGVVHVGSETELNSAVKAVRKGGSAVIALNNDITLTNSPLVISDKKDITLTSNRTDGEFFRLIGAVKNNRYGATISIGDGILRIKGIIVTHEKDVEGNGVYISHDGTLIMYSGKISDNHVPNYTISTNNVGYGGGVRNEGGVFKMYGGEISGNSAGRDGGGVHNGMTPGRFSMFGGKITNNTAGRDGGGVFNYGDGSFYQVGGWIFGNTASNYNNVCNKNHTMTLFYAIVFASIAIGSFGAVFLLLKRKKKEKQAALVKKDTA